MCGHYAPMRDSPSRHESDIADGYTGFMSFDFTRLVYASGNFGKNILWGTADITLLFVLTDLLGMPPAVAGLLLLVSLIVDAVLDPLVGIITDHLHTPLGRYGPLILLGAPLSALTFSGIYLMPTLGISNIWVVGALIMGFRASYSLIDLPHNALMVHVTGDSRERGRLASYRFFFSTLATLTLALSLAPIINDETRQLSPSALATYALIVSCLSVTVIILSWAVVRKKDARAASTPPTPVFDRDNMKAIMASPGFRIVLLAGCTATLTLPLFAKALLYISNHLLNAPEAVSGLLLSMVIGQFAGTPVWAMLMARTEKSRALQYAHAAAVAGFIGFALALVLGPTYARIASFVIGIGLSGVYAIIWAMLADCVDEVEALSGRRPEGMMFALTIFGQKASIGLGVGLFGLCLQGVGYDTATPISPAVTAAILLFGLGLPALGGAVCTMALSAYPLTHKRHHDLKRGVIGQEPE